MMSHWAERSEEARVAEGVAVMWRLVTERLGLAVTLAEVQHSYCSTVQYSTVQYCTGAAQLRRAEDQRRGRDGGRRPGALPQQE